MTHRSHRRGDWLDLDEAGPGVRQNIRRGSIVKIGDEGPLFVQQRRGKRARVAPIDLEVEILTRQPLPPIEVVLDAVRGEETRTVGVAQITHAMAGGRR